MRILFVASMLISAAAFAKDSCHIDAGPDDVVQKKGDIVIEAGKTVHDVIALRGQVTVKKGAKVHSIISVKGDVVVEAGAEVTDAIIVLKGKTVVDPSATVGSRVSLDNGLSISNDSGDGFHGDFNVDGESLSKRIVKEALKKIDGCVVASTN